MDEFQEKQNLIRELLVERHLDALLLNRVSSFAWATCGASSYVNTAVSEGASCLLIAPSGRYVITNNIEAPRLEQEEKLGAQGWEMRVSAWHQKDSAVSQLTRGLRLGADSALPGSVDLSYELARVRANLTSEERGRFRTLGRLCADAMDITARSIQPGMTEYEIAGRLALETQSRGAQAIVNLVATDERTLLFRHPLPTDKKLERYAMIVLCGRKWGLVVSVSRLVHFGSLPDELRRKAEACARIDALFINATRPGRTLGDIFRSASDVYELTWFKDEWRLHHQGGAGGYEPREYLATPDSADKVAIGQVYAWNPSIAGTKSEDTILVGAAENEVLTSMDSWPSLSIDLDNGAMFSRPSILEIL